VGVGYCRHLTHICYYYLKILLVLNYLNKVEQEISQERINAWMDHFGMNKFQCHCSGHARSKDLLQIVEEINARTIYPVHTERPKMYKKAVKNVVQVKDKHIYYDKISVMSLYGQVHCAENLNRYDVLKQLSSITGIKDIDKLDDFTDTLLDTIKENTNINVSDGLDKDELFQALNELSRRGDISGEPLFLLRTKFFPT
jgi:Zn-dependent metallo-hydrolase RNA specificity domain